jgi:dolichol-phosphate mannosyltransferase
VFFMGGVQLLCVGVLAEYIGRIYDEVRRRPISLINAVHRVQAVPSVAAEDVLPAAA